MIIVDIETSGLYPDKYGIVEIGALKFENPISYFQSFCRLDDEDLIDDKALEINGQTREEVRNIKRLSQKKVLERFFEWIKKENDFYAAGENVGSFDLNFIETKTKKYCLKYPFQHRSYDLNTAATLRYEQVHGKLLIENGKNQLALSQILEFVGLRDERGKHNALEDCKLEAEAISRIRHGKGLFEEYNHFPVPNYLKERGENDNI